MQRVVALTCAEPPGEATHWTGPVILDNYGSHKHPKVIAWLARHPRWTFHFTPTSGSWLNAGRDLLLGAHPASPQTRHLPLR